MKKIIIAIAVIAAGMCLYSFKTSGGESSKIVIVSMLNGKGDNEGFMITYGDGTIEKRPFKTKLRALDTDSWVEIQSQAATILSEFKEKGYRFKGAHTFLTAGMILEKD